MTSFSIDLADDTATMLREIAEVTAKTPDSLIRQAVEELVADYLGGRIATQRLADPSDEVISSAELRQRREGVETAPAPTEVLAMARATLVDVPAAERDLLTRKLVEH